MGKCVEYGYAYKVFNASKHLLMSVLCKAAICANVICLLGQDYTNCYYTFL